MRFEWNALKVAANLRKHDVSFDEAASAFFDPLSATGDDPDHSRDERRFVTFGVSSLVLGQDLGEILVWVYYSAQVLLFGAEFIRAYTHRFGSTSHVILLP